MAKQLRLALNHQSAKLSPRVDTSRRRCGWPSITSPLNSHEPERVRPVCCGWPSITSPLNWPAISRSTRTRLRLALNHQSAKLRPEMPTLSQ